MLLVEKFKTALKNSRLYNPVFNFTPLMSSLGWYSGDYFSCYQNPPRDPILSLANKDISVWYITHEQARPVALEFALNYFKEPEKNKIFFERYQRFSKIVDHLYQQNDGSFESLQKLVEAELYTNAAGWFSVYFDRELVEEVLQRVRLTITPAKLDEIIERSSDPLGGSFEVRAELALLELIKKGVSVAEAATQMQYKFAGFNGCDSVEKVEQTLKQEYGDCFSNPAKATQRLEQTKNNLEKKEKDFTNWQRSLTPDEKKFSEYMQTTTVMKDALRDYIGKTAAGVYRVLIPLLRDANIDEGFAKFVLFEEIIQGKEFLAAHRDEIIARENGFGFIVSPTIPLTAEAGDIVGVKQELEAIFMKQNGLDNSAGETLIKGQPACKGLVTGKVRKILDLEKEGKNMQPGEILVTGMTRPEFVPLMKVAGAIVTDEGGITCHAAIVSRELNKPCVIGTKIATRILKDGDMVEVDADQGIIRILSKAGADGQTQ